MTNRITRERLKEILLTQTQTELINLYYRHWTKKAIVDDILHGNDNKSLTKHLQKHGWDFTVVDGGKYV